MLARLVTMGRKNKVYAVKRGRAPGIYDTWELCSAQVSGFSGAQFKSFPTREECLLYLQASPVPESPRVVSVKKSSESEEKSTRLVVYTDGACSGNGYDAAAAGFGVWFGEDDPRNIAGRLSGKQTNQRAELMAIKVCLEHTDSSLPLEIKTDSKYSIDAITIWMPQVDKHPAKRARYENYDLMWEVYKMCKARDVLLTYVKGHAQIHGNEGADALARKGCEMARSESHQSLSIQ